MHQKHSRHVVLFLVLCFSLALGPGSIATAAEGYWKFSRVIEVKQERDQTPKSGYKGYLSDASYGLPGKPGTVTTNREYRKNKHQVTFRAQHTWSAFPEILKPGSHYEITLGIHQKEFSHQGHPLVFGASISLTHSSTWKPQHPMNKRPFFRLGDFTIRRTLKGAPASKKETYSAKAPGPATSGKTQYAVKVTSFMPDARIEVIHLYDWVASTPEKAFHCPHCGKKIDARLLP